MTIDIAIDKDNELIIENSDLKLISGVPEVAQRLKIRMQFFTNDWYLNIFYGIPYYEQFFVKNPNKANIRAIIKFWILTTPAVLEITSFSLDYQNEFRKLIETFTVKSETGEQIELEEVVSG